MADKETPKTPLSGNEYAALRCFFGVVSTMTIHQGRLEKRIRSIPNGWRNWRFIQSSADRLLDELIETIPPNKLKQIRTELAHTRVFVEVRREFCNPAVDRDEKMMTYVPMRALERIMAVAVNNECLFCERSGKVAKKCPLRADLNAMYPFEVEKEPELANGQECPFAGWRIDDAETESVQDT